MAATRSTDDTLRVDGREYHPLPQSWADHGRHADLLESGGQARVYATMVAIDEQRESLFVRYVHPVNPDVFVREFDAVRRGGSWLPRCYVDDGPQAFSVSLGVDWFRHSNHDVRLGERDWLWELYQDRLADTAFSRGGGSA